MEGWHLKYSITEHNKFAISYQTMVLRKETQMKSYTTMTEKYGSEIIWTLTQTRKQGRHK
jgi:hypothetical protein